MKVEKRVADDIDLLDPLRFVIFVIRAFVCESKFGFQGISREEWYSAVLSSSKAGTQ